MPVGNSTNESSIQTILPPLPPPNPIIWVGSLLSGAISWFQGLFGEAGS